MNSNEVFIHIHQGCFAGTGAIVRLPQYQWSKPDGYEKISQCITTTTHSKAKNVCIFIGIYCIAPRPWAWWEQVMYQMKGWRLDGITLMWHHCNGVYINIYIGWVCNQLDFRTSTNAVSDWLKDDLIPWIEWDDYLGNFFNYSLWYLLPHDSIRRPSPTYMALNALP